MLRLIYNFVRILSAEFVLNVFYNNAYNDFCYEFLSLKASLISEKSFLESNSIIYGGQHISTLHCKTTTTTKKTTTTTMNTEFTPGIGEVFTLLHLENTSVFCRPLHIVTYSQ